MDTRPLDLTTPSAISRMRRNHGLEHATIHLLTARHPKRLLIGRSDSSGFYLYGDVPTEAVATAAAEALARLARGERQLAIHPNCGTSLLTSGILACAAAVFSISTGRSDHWQDRLARFPFAVLLTVLALIVAQPLGLSLQRRVTTLADPQGLQIVGVRRINRGRMAVHHVLTS